MRLKAVVLSFLFLHALCFARTDGGLKLNYSEVDISTDVDEHCVLAGFAARSGLSEGVHHNIYSRCLVITDGEQKVCIISNDLMELSPSISYEMRRRIADASGIPIQNVLMHCIHTHSTPRSGGPSSQPGGSNYNWKTRMTDKVVSNAVATVRDDKAFKSFSLEVGKGMTSINFNRCEEGGPVDRSVYVVRFVDGKGRPMVSIINLACHPVCMGPGSYAVSSDYFGTASDLLKKSWGGNVMQLTGAAGNMDPTGGPKDYRHAEACGKSLADSLIDIPFSSRGKSKGLLKLVHRTVSLPYRIAEVTPQAVRAHADSLVNASTGFPRFASDVRGWEEEILARFETEEVSSSLEFDLTALNVDGVIFFFTQGEPFCEYQAEARDAFPDETVFFAGYTNGQNSYLPSAHAYRHHKGYEYEIDQMHVYIKAPYPLSSEMPAIYRNAVTETISAAVCLPEKYGIIPQPQSLKPGPGYFHITGRCSIGYGDDEFREVAEDFASQLRTVTPYSIPVRRVGRIQICRVDSLALEEYGLSVTPSSVKISANSREGAFYAIQSLIQMLPPEFYAEKLRTDIDWKVPSCEIMDKPHFSYRALMLDCGRYFYPKESVMQFIDQMSRRKFNVFHWHLTEDQGWRIEIKKYPKLTGIGAFRKETSGYDNVGNGIPHGGFYTQDDIREVVEYARKRCVTVVPEIELPGHSSAAIAAYPFLSCTPEESKEVSCSWGVKEDVYCPTPETITFLEDVFTELFDLFPSKYYHFGGDECPKTAWRESDWCRDFAEQQGLGSVDDIQDFFVEHFTRFLNDHGKTVIGWDEILDGPSASRAIAMSYRGHAPARRAITSGISCILAPNRWCYLDNPQCELTATGDFNIFMPLSKVYQYYPEVEEEPELSSEWIIGYAGCVWGEHLPDMDKVFYQTFPRACAMAENAWTEKSSKNWTSFRERMQKELCRMSEAKIPYCKSYYDVIYRFDNRTDYPWDVVLELNCPSASIHYTLDGTEPTVKSASYILPIEVRSGVTIKARGFDSDGNAIGCTSIKTF